MLEVNTEICKYAEKSDAIPESTIIFDVMDLAA